MDNQSGAYAGLRELALFAGAGGGILGGHLLGWRTVCAVEYNTYAASVLLARQNDGILSHFPIWDDVRTFDGRPWRGIVDVVSGGFPCQDISCAGKGAGITGERSGLWSEFSRIIGEVRPRFVFVENSPMLTVRGGDRVVADLAALGYDAKWMCLSAADCGAPHKRDRFWLVGNTNDYGQAATKERGSIAQGGNAGETWKKQACEPTRPSEQYAELADPASLGQQGQGKPIDPVHCTEKRERETDNVEPMRINREWPPEPNVGRVVDGMAARMDRLTALGNGQVPRVAATAFQNLAGRIGISHNTNSMPRR